MPRQRRAIPPGRRSRNKRKEVRDTLLPYDLSLATTQNTPFPSLTLPIRNHVYEARSGRSFPNGNDPKWEHEWIFEGHIRAPFDVRAEQLGEVANEHCYENNPLAGRGSTNESFLAADYLGDDAFDADIANVNGQGFKPQAVDLLDPFAAAASASNIQLQNQALQVFLDSTRGPDTNPVIDPNTHQAVLDEHGNPITRNTHQHNLAKHLQTQQSHDVNYLRSMGYDAIADPRQNHALKTKHGQPIPYFVSDEIYQVEAEENPWAGEDISFGYNTDYWVDWFGYQVGTLKTPKVGDPDELIHGGNEFMRRITGTDAKEQEFTLGTHQFEDAEIAPDHLNLLTYEGNPGAEEQSLRDDAVRLRERQLLHYDYI